MSHSDNFKHYIDIVCNQIRWKKSHNIISKELKNHFDDQKDYFIKSGMELEKAEQLAIKELGDPLSVGAEFDRIYRPKINKSMFFIIAILLFISIVVRCSLPDVNITSMSLSLIIGIGAMLLAFTIDYRNIVKYSKYAYIAILVIMFLTSIFGLAINGRKAFISVASLSVSVIYLSLLLPVVMTAIIYEFRGKGISGILLSGILIMIPMIFIILIQYISTMLIIGVIMLAIILYTIGNDWFRCNKKLAYCLVLLPIIAFCTFVVIRYYPNIVTKLEILVNPYSDPMGRGYVSVMVRDILSCCVMLGEGSGNIESVPNFGTEYILTYIAHKFGFMVLGIVLILFVLMTIIAFKISSKHTSSIGSAMSLAIIMTFVAPSLIYLINNLGFYFISSSSMPFISGNTAIVINMFLLGILLSLHHDSSLITEYITKNSPPNIIEFTVDKDIVIHIKKFLP